MTTETVKLDVGGTKYKVSRSLIEAYPTTMLARMVSKTWQKNPNEELYIERDGLRFRCVLDYMRDQKVHVPLNTAKASVLQDLEYFGFEDVPDDAIDVGCSNIAAMDHWAMMNKDHKERLEKHAQGYFYELIAHECCKNYAAGRKSFIADETFRRELANIPKLKSRFSKSVLESYLSKLGLAPQALFCPNDMITPGSFVLQFQLRKID